jgi:hypothetical protein
MRKTINQKTRKVLFGLIFTAALYAFFALISRSLFLEVNFSTGVEFVFVIFSFVFVIGFLNFLIIWVLGKFAFFGESVVNVFVPCCLGVIIWFYFDGGGNIISLIFSIISVLFVCWPVYIFAKQKSEPANKAGRGSPSHHS